MDKEDLEFINQGLLVAQAEDLTEAKSDTINFFN